MNIIYVLDVAEPHSSLGIIFRFDSSASVQHFFSPVVLLYWIRIQVLCSASLRLYMHAPCCNGVRQPTTTIAAIQPQCNRSTTRTECQVQWHSLIKKRTHNESTIFCLCLMCLSLSLYIHNSGYTGIVASNVYSFCALTRTRTNGRERTAAVAS